MLSPYIAATVVVSLLRDRRLRQGGVKSLAALGVTEGPLADWMRAASLTREGRRTRW